MNPQITLPGASSETVNQIVPDNLIMLGYRGSIAHGMYVPKNDPNSIDDKDLMGVYVGSLNHYVGLIDKKDSYERFIGEWDTVHYELRKLFGLLLKGNPNVLTLLFLDDKYVIYKSELWDEVLLNKDIFISKQAYQSFVGYAFGQMKRMEHGSKKGYMGAKREELVLKFGYDTKNAAHLIRLLRMGVEFLNEGQLHVDRSGIDATQLLEIKKGGWSLEQVKQEADHLFRLAELAYLSSKLPAVPDVEKANKLVQSLILRYHVPQMYSKSPI